MKVRVLVMVMVMVGLSDHLMAIDLVLSQRDSTSTPNYSQSLSTRVRLTLKMTVMLASDLDWLRVAGNLVDAPCKWCLMLCVIIMLQSAVSFS